MRYPMHVPERRALLLALASAGALASINARSAESPQLKQLRPWTAGATPTLELRDLAGATRKLGDFRGKVVLLNFWATWCEPCRDEMPSMQALKKRFTGRPFEIVAVNYGESREKIEAFLAKVPVDFIMLVDTEQSAPRQWKVRVLPASFIIGIDGRIRYSAIGELDWASDSVAKSIESLLPK